MCVGPPDPPETDPGQPTELEQALAAPPWNFSAQQARDLTHAERFAQQRPLELEDLEAWLRLPDERPRLFARVTNHMGYLRSLLVQCGRPSAAGFQAEPASSDGAAEEALRIRQLERQEADRRARAEAVPAEQLGFSPIDEFRRRRAAQAPPTE